MANPASVFFILGGIAVVLGLMFFNSSPAPRVYKGVNMDQDDIERAALKIIYPLPNCPKSWIGGTVGACDSAQRELDKKRAQYASFEPVWMRDAIMQWFDYAQRDINESREDCITQKSKKDQDSYRERTSEENKRAAQVLRSIGR